MATIRSFKGGEPTEKRFALIGEKLGHSFSPAIHRKLGIENYTLLETPRERLEATLRDTRYGGFNVTIPYKQDVMGFCDEISPGAQAIGSVNTVVSARDGRLCGYNTDIDGFIYLTRYAGITLCGKKVLILGSGGTSLTAQAAAKTLGAARITVLSRSGENSYANAGAFDDSEILINTTPVGMYPDNLALPLALDAFLELEGVLDVIYNPRRTALLQSGQAKNIPCMDGLPMLVYQAKRAQELFLEKAVSDDAAISVIRALRAESGNIVLVGMPGSGKSTVARHIAGLSGKRFIDTDAEIEHGANKTIPEIFAQDGEEAFRALEHQAVLNAGKQTGAVIATGGGIVKDENNLAPLRQNGRIYYLARALEALETKGRPLSKDLRAVEKLFAEREGLYRRFADAVIINDASPEQAAERILEDYNENLGD